MSVHATLTSCWLAVVTAVCLQAQTAIRSTVVGTVRDSQAAIVPGADVTLRNTDTAIEWRTVSGAGGEYVFPNLMAGKYLVEVVKPGFRKSVSPVTSLENGATLRMDMALAVGQITEQVTVSAAAPLLQTDDASVGQVLENRILRDVPVESRNFLNYAVLAPMFNSGAEDQTRAVWGLASATAPNAKVLNLGGTEYGVGYYIDGLNANDNWVEGPTTNVNLDSVLEVKTEVINYSAEYGRDVGQLSFTTKSGTNQLHGSGFLYRQNSGLNARDPYTIFEDPTRGRDPYHQNQYGFTAGGPVYIPKVFNGRNRAFFFVGYEALRNRAQSTMLAYVPTARERTGDFGEWLERFPGAPRYVIYDPFSFDPATQRRQPYPGNVITSVNSKAAEFVSRFPMPNFQSPNAEDIRNWRGTTTNGINSNNISARADYMLSSRDSVFFKFSRDTGSKLNVGGLIPEVTLGNGPIHKSDTYNAHWVRTFSPFLTNEVIFGYLYATNRPESSGAIRNLQKVSWFRNLVQNVSLPDGGLSDFDKQQLEISDDGIYALQFDGDPFSRLSVGPGEYWYQVIPQLQIADNATRIFRRHTFKAGFHYFRRDERDNDIIRSITIGGNRYTGAGPQVTDGSGWNTLAEFMTGVVTSQTQRTRNIGGDNSLWFRMPEWAGFLNDSWQVRPRLTLNLGLRYELAPQAYSVNSFWGVLDKNYPGYRLFMPGLTPGTSSRPYAADRNNLGPRFGFAFRVTNEWVLRGGYGIFYETGRYKFMDQMFFNAPGYGGSTYNSNDYAAINGLDPNQVWFTLNNSFPPALDVPKGDWPIPLGDKGGILYPRQDTTTIDEKTPTTPYLQRWSMDVQRRLGKNMTLSAGYVGSKGTQLVIGDDLNLPPEGVYLNSEDFHQARPNSRNPDYIDRFGQILAIHHGGNNAYHSLTGRFQKQFSHGLTVLTHYTWSKFTDAFFNTNGYSTDAGIGGPWHRNWSHGLSDANHPQRLVSVVTFEIPFARRMRGLGGVLLKDWQVNSIAVFEAGRPATVWNGDTQSFDYKGDVPLRVCDGNLSGGERGFFRYFDTSCFVNPPDLNGDGIADYRGNSGRNIITRPGINNWDISMFKSLAIGEDKKIQFRWETFNTFNHPQWSDINTYNDTGTNPLSTFGRVTAGRPGRHMQWALKFLF